MKRVVRGSPPGSLSLAPFCFFSFFILSSPPRSSSPHPRLLYGTAPPCTSAHNYNQRFAGASGSDVDDDGTLSDVRGMSGVTGVVRVLLRERGKGVQAFTSRVHSRVCPSLSLNIFFIPPSISFLLL